MREEKLLDKQEGNDLPIIKRETMNMLNEYEKLVRDNQRYGACEDDVECTAPYIDLCPDESEHESGSPLSFGRRWYIKLKT